MVVAGLGGHVLGGQVLGGSVRGGSLVLGGGLVGGLVGGLGGGSTGRGAQSAPPMPAALSPILPKDGPTMDHSNPLGLDSVILVTDTPSLSTSPASGTRERTMFISGVRRL